MRLKPDLGPIGMCGLLKRKYLPYPDLGFAILPVYEGKGLTKEAALVVIQYAFEKLNQPELYAITSLNNKRSQGLLGKLGFDWDSEREVIEDRIQVYKKAFTQS
jgi:RimJ/RimL family protein N-acetyltransferase